MRGERWGIRYQYEGARTDWLTIKENDVAISADTDTLMRQAPATAAEYLREAVRAIDKQFEDGYASKHPELVATLIDVSAKDFNNAILIVAIQEASEKIAEALARAK